MILKKELKNMKKILEKKFKLYFLHINNYKIIKV